jgi:hypothetical protein
MVILTESGNELLLFRTHWEKSEKGMQLIEKFTLKNEAQWWVVDSRLRLPLLYMQCRSERSVREWHLSCIV